MEKTVSMRLLQTLNSLVNFVILICLLVAIAYAGFALWDNHRIYTAAEDIQLQMEKIKPIIDEETGGASFEELLAINSDVRAWVTLDGTAIDYPVVQGTTNRTYLNMDVYGDFALAGSIFLDSRNQGDFSAPYNLLYGHHMSGSRMFGDLDLYKDQTFFDENSTGTLITPEGTYELEIFACLVVGAGEDRIFDVDLWQDDIQELLDFVRTDSLFVREDWLSKLEAMDNPRILACSTCSSEFTDARTIILAAMIS